MTTALPETLKAGFERLSAWADLLDRINIFPVADGDTGRNLVVSLAPLRDGSPLVGDREGYIRRLLLSARGNAGNIAARFFSGFLRKTVQNNPEALAAGVKEGRTLAWQAVADPKPGTMLTLFDALDEILQNSPPELDELGIDAIVGHLAEAVRSTPRLLPRLRDAGVVDSGALGMYLFFEGFFSVLAGRDTERPFTPLHQVFPEGLRLSPAFPSSAAEESGYCLDVTLRAPALTPDAISRLTTSGRSVVISADGEYLKVHLHTPDAAAVRREISRFGEVVSWKEDNLGEEEEKFCASIPQSESPIHVMTDAAGSLTREQARQLGFTLLDSYVTLGERSLPETSFDHAELYSAMRRGIRAATSQASLFERHQLYAQVLEQNSRVLYLCVGSAFTGNLAAVQDWKKRHDPEDRLLALDSGAASGRLGLLALAVARFAQEAKDGEFVIAFARRLLNRCEEYLFPDGLQYLAAGGRLSRTGAILGNLLHVKPVISPTPEGAKKVCTVHSRDEQLRFALDRLSRILPLPSGTDLMIMLEYTDNKDWVKSELQEAVSRQVSDAEILIQPLSLTAGVHTGPGTWGMAFLTIPEEQEKTGDRKRESQKT
ncbi:MAG: DegV domain-containing protein [Syntrophus sp. PtaB.Bin001]|nr:MAG: DegV domain-containing protein [Syntrophus sp. PtaB.Bin001]